MKHALRLILCIVACLIVITGNAASASARHQRSYPEYQRAAFYKASYRHFASYTSNRSVPRRDAATRLDGRGFMMASSAYRSFASREPGSFGTASRHDANNHYAVSSGRYEPSSYTPSSSYTPNSGYTPSSYGSGGRPSAWCGWEMRQLVGGDPGPEYNLASNWAHWGHAAGGPAPGVVGVMAHHVIKVISVVGPGEVMAISGNDDHAVRTRLWSTSGVFAWRRG